VVKHEIEMMESVQHINTIQLIDNFIEESKVYLVMELLDGPDLFSFLQSEEGGVLRDEDIL